MLGDQRQQLSNKSHDIYDCCCVTRESHANGSLYEGIYSDGNEDANEQPDN